MMDYWQVRKLKLKPLSPLTFRQFWDSQVWMISFLSQEETVVSDAHRQRVKVHQAPSVNVSALEASDWKSLHTFFCSSRCSELPAAAARPEPARHHHEVRRHGQEGDQQADEAEGEEERVDERSQWRGESLQDKKTQQAMEKWRKVKKKEQEFKKSSCCPGLCTLFWFSVSFLTHTFKPHHTQGFILLLN